MKCWKKNIDFRYFSLGVKRLMQGTVEIYELRENLGVKLKYRANTADRSFDSTSQSATPNSSADIADK